MTTSIPLLLVPLWPLLLALATQGLRRRQAGRPLAVLGALPALAASLQAPSPEVHYPWLMLGARLGLDSADATFLLFTAVVWLVAAAFAWAWIREARTRFYTLFLLTMSGNLGALVARDLPFFYTSFALMSFAAYGLIAHSFSREAKHAANVYIVLVVVGEAALAGALILASGSTGAIDFASVQAGLATIPTRNLVITLAFLGFGIKAGVLFLHVWLPLAHPVAPAPASAVLSGTIIVTGLVGWMRFLPIGAAALPGWGGLFVALGIAAAFYGAIIGIDQRNPKVVLAYSSISQMGIMTVGVGMMLLEPGLSDTLRAAIAFFALHHGLSKSALFLGAGLARAGLGETRRRWLIIGLAGPSLALAGAPLTSGMVAKSALAVSEATLAEPWAGVIQTLLPLTSVATALLMARFLVLVSRAPAGEKPQSATGPLYAWCASLAFALLLPWWLVPESAESFSGQSFVHSLWPLGVALAIAAVALAGWRRAGRPAVPEIPAGDLLLPLERLTLWLRTIALAVAVHMRSVRDRLRKAAAIGRNLAWPLVLSTVTAETMLNRWRIALTLAVMVGVVLVLIAW